MSQNKKSLFEIIKIDDTNGTMTVKFINQFGCIQTGEKTIEDFMEIVDVPTGSFTLEGVPITKPQTILINDNPNEDLVNNIDIPYDENGQYFSIDKLLNHVATHYPYDFFYDKHKRKQLTIANEIKQLVGQKIEISISTEQPNIIVVPEITVEEI